VRSILSRKVVCKARDETTMQALSPSPVASSMSIRRENAVRHDRDDLYECIRRLMDAYIPSPEGEGDMHIDDLAVMCRPVHASRSLTEVGDSALRRAQPSGPD
jgi:hypothetical protein